MNLIEKNPNIIIKYCEENEKEKYLKIFYMILLYFRQKYEIDKYPEVFYKKELWKYFVEIISENYGFYEYKYIPEELYIEIIKKILLIFIILKYIFPLLNLRNNY